MTDTLQITTTITDRGRAAVTNARNNGLAAEVTHIAIGSGSGTPSASDTTLLNEIKRIPANTGTNPSPSELYIEVADFSGDEYSVYEFAPVLSDGTLLAVYRQTTPIIETTAVVPLLLQISIPIQSFPPDSVMVNGDTNFQTPQASETMAGMAEIATQSEVNAGTDHKRIVTAKTLKSRLASFVRNATESVKGFVEIATQSEANGSTDDSRAITAKKLHNRTATETRRGVAEVATQAEVNAGTDNYRIVTPKKLWALLTAKFARTDVRPTFSQGIDTNGNPVKFGGGSGQFEGIRYEDTSDQPGTFHMVADGDPDETSEGNAFLKLGGIRLGSGNKVTGVSSSTISQSTSTLADSKSVNDVRKIAERSATESQKGQVERATQAEVDAGTDDSRFVTSQKLASRLALFARDATETITGFLRVGTQNEVDNGTLDDVAVTPETLKGSSSVSASPAGYIRLPKIFGGILIQWGTVFFPPPSLERRITYPVAFSRPPFSIAISQVDAATISKMGATGFIRDETGDRTTGFNLLVDTTGYVCGWVAIGV